MLRKRNQLGSKENGSREKEEPSRLALSIYVLIILWVFIHRATDFGVTKLQKGQSV